jgi:hypothetical protein
MRTKRNAVIDIQFQHGFAVGWHFGVASACRDALDLKLTARVVKNAAGSSKENIWTRGAPPDYAFTVGDTFHAPAEVALLPWQQALKKLQHSVQVVAIDAATVTVVAIAYRDQTPQLPEHYTLTQDALAAWLQSGIRPETAVTVHTP